MKKRMPIGVSDFRELIQDDYYYVDKTLFIREIMSTAPKVTLLPRPRRFGKTLNLSMLRYFFEKNDGDFAGDYAGDFA
ncbi:MAG: AAA family ATPase, partial [Desulfobacterales bacterium]|nr:AAA family ATPase [Desulfobacterales bacterium]